MDLMRWLVAVAILGPAAGCMTTEAIVLSDGAAVIARATMSDEFPQSRHGGISSHSRTFVLDGLGEFTSDGVACVLVVDRPHFGPFRFSSPRCVVSIQFDRICIDEVVLRDELAKSDDLPASLQLRGCAKLSPPPAVIVERSQPPPEPREVCEPVGALGEEQRRITAVVVLSSTEVLEAKTNSDGDWVVCYWGIPMRSFSYQLELTFDDGASTSVTWSSRTVID